MKRAKKIVRVSIYGILVNLILVVFKAVVGLISNSIAILLDAVNNLSDAFSSIVTIIGVKLSERRPDKKHPFGHGRIEYIAAIVIAASVLIAGVISLKESIEKIINPVEADYSVVALVIILVAVLVKFFFGKYVKRSGEELNSGSLVASGVDALSDAVLSFSVFVAAMISFIWHISLEGYLGVVISAMIIKTAVEILKKAVDDMVGVRVDDKVVKKLKKIIDANKEVHGVYDIAIHNYGPNKMVASAHIQVDDDMTAREIHQLTRNIGMEVFEKMGIVLTIGIYASNEVGEYKAIKRYITKILNEYDKVLQMHGFYVDEKNKMIMFDVIFDFEERQAEKKQKEIVARLKEKYPEYNFNIILDRDISG